MFETTTFSISIISFLSFCMYDPNTARQSKAVIRQAETMPLVLLFSIKMQPPLPHLPLAKTILCKNPFQNAVCPPYQSLFADKSQRVFLHMPFLFHPEH